MMAHKRLSYRNLLYALGWCLWLVFVFLLAALVASLLVTVVKDYSGYDLMSSTVGVAVMQVVQLLLMLSFATTWPYRIGKYRHQNMVQRRAAKMQAVGLSRLPNLSDLISLLQGVAIYYAAASTLIALASLVLPREVINQVQNVGFAATGNNWWQLIAIGISLVVAAPVFEELLFRGLMFTKLGDNLGKVAAALIVSLLFAMAHGQINVGLTTFVLSMVSCWLRHRTGAIWSSVGLHAVSNFIAFFLVYVLSM